jgi:hypothetical protein
MGIGWTGQWAASFAPAADGGAALRAAESRLGLWHEQGSGP